MCAVAKIGGCTFCGTQLNSSRLLASDLSSSFHTFAEKILNGLSTNLVDELIMVLARPEYLRSHFAEYPPFLGLLSFLSSFHTLAMALIDTPDWIELKNGGQDH